MKHIKHLTNAMIDAIIEADDQSRYAVQGGYPSVWQRVGGNIVVASVDHDDAPTLDVYTSDGAFLTSNGHELEDDGIDFDSGVLRKIESSNRSGFTLVWMTEDESKGAA